MRTLIASSLGLAAMTSVALAEGAAPESRQTADLLRLTERQMDDLTAAGDQTQNNFNFCLLLCNNNNQQAGGSNTSGDQLFEGILLGNLFLGLL